MAKASEVYDKVTAAIVAKLEAGDPGPWTRPFSDGAGLPTNAETRKAYRGGNILACWAAEMVESYPSSWWATYNQWQSLGAQVRKGEKATNLVRWIEPKPKDDDGETKRRGGLIPFGFSVFNAAQVDGWVVPEVEAGPDPIEHAEEFFAAVGADVRRAGGRAFYSPVGDYIGIPPIDDFKDATGFYATLGHEHVHWSGHEDRVKRDLTGRFGDEAYAAEELVAEIGASFLGALLGIEVEPRPDHASYVKSWISVLNNDHAAIFTAATQAQKAVDFLVERGGLVVNDEEKVSVSA